jgi:hypothetical protein
MLFLAFCATAIQGFDKHVESEMSENRAMVMRLDEATKRGRIAFADAKNDKEYQAAIDILVSAERVFSPLRKGGVVRKGNKFAPRNG